MRSHLIRLLRSDWTLLVGVAVAFIAVYRAAPAPKPKPLPRPFTPPPTEFQVVAVDTLLSVVCYEVKAQVSCVWIQSAGKVKRQLGLN